VARPGEEEPEDEDQPRDDDCVKDPVAQVDGEELAHGGAKGYEDGDPGSLPPVNEPLAIEMDGTSEPERDDAEAVGAVGHVLRKAGELERRQRDGGAVACEGADEAADEASYGDEDSLKRHPEPPCVLSLVRDRLYPVYLSNLFLVVDRPVQIQGELPV